MSEGDNLSVPIETTTNPEPVLESPPVEQEQQRQPEEPQKQQEEPQRQQEPQKEQPPQDLPKAEVPVEVTEKISKEPEKPAESEKLKLSVEVEDKSPQNREVTPQLPPKNKNLSSSSLVNSPKSNASDAPKKETKRVVASATIESDPIRSTMKTFSQLQEESNKKKKKKKMIERNVKKKTTKNHYLIKLKNLLNS